MLQKNTAVRVGLRPKVNTRNDTHIMRSNSGERIGLVLRLGKQRQYVGFESR